MHQEQTSRISRRRQAARSEGAADYTAKRAELMRLGAEVFREKGYHAATLNDIAARFGTDRASLYYYVGSKEELFQECIKGVVADNIRRAREINDLGISPRDRLARLIQLIIGSQVEHYPYMFVYIQEDMSQIVTQDAQWATEMVAHTHRMERFFIDALDEGVADGTFREGVSTTLMANALFGMMMWTHRWYTPGRKYTSEEIVDAFATVYFDGIEKPAQTR